MWIDEFFCRFDTGLTPLAVEDVYVVPNFVVQILFNTGILCSV